MKANKKVLYISDVKGVVDESKQLISGVVGSTGTIDRQGESINPMGWILDNYTKNPVILYGHDYHSLPIGKAVRVWLEDGKLMFDIEFAGTDLGKEVFQLFKDKFLNAFSVGFIPKKFGVSGVDEYDIMEQELLELSAVPVPANPEALSYLKENAPVFAKSFVKEEEPPQDEPPQDEPPKDDLPTDEKSGRVLSKANEDKLREVHKSIGELLAQLDKKEVDAEPPKDEPPTPPQDEPPKDEPPKDNPEGDKPLSDDTVKTIKAMADHFKQSDKHTGLGLKLLKDLKQALEVKS